MFGLFNNIILGISLAASPGPVSVEVIQRGLRGGFMRAFLVALGSALGDAMYLLVIYFGLAHLLFHPIAKMSIWCFGIIMLLVLGIQTIRGAFKPKELQGSTSVSDRNPIVAGFLLAIINPTSIAWWLGVFGTTMAASNEPVSFLALLHNSTIILGVILWFLFLSSLLHFGKSWIGPRYMRWVPVGAGTLLIALAGYFGWQAVQDLQQLIA